MSDFVSGFWNLYVVVIVLASILACAVLLYMQGKATFTPGKTMGHVWDETLEEYNNPMPKWWSWLFVVTVIFALVYLAGWLVNLSLLVVFVDHLGQPFLEVSAVTATSNKCAQIE